MIQIGCLWKKPSPEYDQIIRKTKIAREIVLQFKLNHRSFYYLELHLASDLSQILHKTCEK